MFVSLYFLVFLAVLWLLYMVVLKPWRKVLLLVFSYGFCGYLSVRALVVLAVSTVVTYCAAKLIEKHQSDRKTAKLAAAVTIALFAVTLVAVKNIPYAIKIISPSLFERGYWYSSIVLPLGFSFYAFQAIGYLYDVYKGREKAEQDFVSFALYMGFFAKLVSGPIERKGSFGEQVDKLADVRVFELERISLAVTYMIWGYFLKLVVADRLALIVNEIHAVPEFFDTLWLIGGAVFYSFQVYADFAGYTCIAMGCAGLFGIELTQNFASPYCSKNITEFWRRWHKSLSSWLRDYVYIPLGGNRRGNLRKHRNTLVVFILCGIWHGNGLSYVAWGLLHGIYSIFDNTLGKRFQTDSVLGIWMGRTVNFLAVTFAWIFFRAESLKLALKYIRCMCTNGIAPRSSVMVFEAGEVQLLQVLLGFMLIVLVWVLDGICYKYAKTLPELLQNKRLLKYGFYYCCLIAIFIFGIYGGAFKTENFIYMQF